MRLVCVLVAFAALASGQAPDLHGLMQRALDAGARNEAKARQYTWRTERVLWRIDKKGNKSNLTTQVWEATRVGDKTENKLISRNGEQLTNPTPKDWRLQSGFNLSLAFNLPMVPTLFGVTYLREEEFRGRKCWIILATPKTDAIRKTPNDRELANFRATLWIEQAGAGIPRGQLEVIGDKSELDKGSTFEWFTELDDDGTWLVREMHIVYSARKGKARGEWHETHSDFRRFDVKSRVVADPQ